MGYFISYSAPSREKLLYRIFLAMLLLWLLTVGYIWKERILLFLLFPGKEELGKQILTEEIAGIQDGDRIVQTLMAVLQRCRYG